ncbi:MAG TPA: OmpA family protein [Aquabacterium sp.]|uniref:OmpA family protein n=1 Tax=Aquabacterium sp. TaxID=1872578 RepID=UPI002E347ED3|nr:OmpA family protein [Aquabacterium sp.]HEX5357608.1 OmpA family protein [Aquabacterium sp.]
MNTSSISALTRSLLAAALSAGLALAHAQAHAEGPAAPTTVLKGKAVTETNLIDALTPEEPVVTRSLRVQRDTPGQQAARKPSASLLITFETNSADLTPQAKKQLDVVAAALRNNKLADYGFNVEGHADPRGTHDINLSLSQQRAESVRNYLISAHSIDAKRLKAVGKGDSEVLNAKDPAAVENRRVTIVTDVSKD